MKKHFRLLAVLLMVTMLFSLAACADSGSDDPKDTSAPNAADTSDDAAGTDTGSGNDGTAAGTDAAVTDAPDEPYYLDTLTDQRFDGTTFTMIAENTEQRPNFDNDTVTGDTINDAIYNRKIAIEDRYGITIETVSMATRGKCNTEVKNKVLANDDLYDLVFNAVATGGMKGLATNGYMAELSELPYLDLTRSHWSQNFVNNMTINDKLFFVAGGASPSYYLSAVVMLFNTEKAVDYQLPDLYKLVEDGKWTVDKLGELLIQSTHDLDGDNIYQPTNDFIGLVQTIEAGNSYFIAAGGNMINKKADGSYALELGNAQSIELMDKLRLVCGDTKTTLAIDAEGVTGLGNTKETKIGLFVDGHAMFATTAMMFAAQELRDMKSYGILPLPKLNEAQKEYITPCNPYAPCGAGIPRSASDLELSALVMEAMAFLGEEIIRPAVYDVTLQGKIAQDEQSARVLELVYSDIYFDLNHCFDFGKSTQLLRSYIVGDDGNSLIVNRGFTSSYKVLEKIAGIEMNDFIDTINKLNASN